MPLAAPARGLMAAAAALGLCHWAVAAAAAVQAAQVCAVGGAEADSGACARPEIPLRLERDHLLVQIGRGLTPPHAKSAGAAAVADEAKEPSEELELEEEAAAADEAKEQSEEDEEVEIATNGTRDAAPSEQGQACEASLITRRRRNDAMCSCRRRHSSQNDLPSGWRCNEAQNRIEWGQECEASLITRRRRNDAMCSCRRRHASQNDLPSGWRCNEAQNRVERGGSPSPPPQGGGGVIGWSTSGPVKSAGLWCQVNVPPAGWHLKACPVSGGSTPVKVLSYNLFWWNLYGMRHGNGGSAGRKIAETSGPEEYDLMGFQECDDMSRILGDAQAQGLGGSYALVNGGRALAIAWRKSRFAWLAEGKGDVGEDHHSQYYGKRSAQWVRLRHRDGRTVFFLNHHGPLPVSKSGGCAGSSTAYNILKMIATNAHKDDVIIVVGDFNAQGHSSRFQAMKGYLNHVYSGTSMGGVDHIFSNCDAVSHQKLGKGGSDHDALNAVFRI